MTPQSSLEIKGNFLTHPFAELLAEIAVARLHGSLRVADKDRKCVVYFKGGRAVFAVSNARSSRLFTTLLAREKITKEELALIPEFENDLELTTYLTEKQLLTKYEYYELFTQQIEAILADLLVWESAEWTFSHLARVRDGLEFRIDITRLLVNFGRSMPVDKMLGRFRSLDEKFSRTEVPETVFNLKPDEAFVLSCADSGPLSATDLLSAAGMSQPDALHAIYTLWLGGLLARGDWQPAFSAESVYSMRSARIEIKREAKMPGVAEVTPAKEEKEETTPEVVPEAPKTPEVTLSLEDYLERAESAETYYDILGVEIKADVDELKRAYFALARKFHPDRYHSVGGETLERIQHAFSELAQAHETLKNPESRELYDFRMRKELADREMARKAGTAGNSQQSLQFAQASENFEHGYTLLMDGEPLAATQFLARAAHYAPKNARYRAYYGKALSGDEKQRHKAEAEMQAALKIEPNNATFRLFLAEFYVRYNLLKRAEGELTRLLALHPNNREASEMLEGLKVVK